MPELPDGALRRGPEEVREVDAGRVPAIVDMTGRGRASGVPAEIRFGQIWMREAGTEP